MPTKKKPDFEPPETWTFARLSDPRLKQAVNHTLRPVLVQRCGVCGALEGEGDAALAVSPRLLLECEECRQRLGKKQPKQWWQW